MSTLGSSSAVPSKVKLLSSDGKEFCVDMEVAIMSPMIKRTIEDSGGDDEDKPIPIPKADEATLSKVMEYCQRHVEDRNRSIFVNIYGKDNIEEFDKKFVEVDSAVLYDLIVAANHLEIESLLDLTCKSVSEVMHGKTAKKFREKFGIKNFYGAEEIQQIKDANPWAFDS